MATESVLAVVGQWESTGKMTLPMAEAIDQQFDDLMKAELGEVEALITNYRQPERAFSRLLRLTAIVTAAAQEKAGIIPKLGEWIKRIGDALRKLAKDFDAEGCTIGLSISPVVGLYVEISF